MDKAAKQREKRNHSPVCYVYVGVFNISSHPERVNRNAHKKGVENNLPFPSDPQSANEACQLSPFPSLYSVSVPSPFSKAQMKSVPNASTLPNRALRSTGCLMLGPLAIPIPSAAAAAAASPAFTPSTGVRDRLGGLIGLLKLNGAGAGARNPGPVLAGAAGALSSSIRLRREGVRLSDRGGGGGGGVQSAGSRE